MSELRDEATLDEDLGGDGLDWFRSRDKLKSTGLKVLYLHDATGFRREVMSAIDQTGRVSMPTTSWTEMLQAVEADPLVVTVLVDEPLTQTAPDFSTLAQLIQHRAPPVQVLQVPVRKRATRAPNRKGRERVQEGRIQRRLVLELVSPGLRPHPVTTQARPFLPEPPPAVRKQQEAPSLGDLRADLVQQMAQEARGLIDIQNQRALERLNLLLGAVNAIDLLLAEGAEES